MAASSPTDAPISGTTTDTRNVNGVDPAKAAAATKDAQKGPQTLKQYRILHEMVGGRKDGRAITFRKGDVASVDDLGGEANLERLFKHGAIAPAV